MSNVVSRLLAAAFIGGGVAVAGLAVGHGLERFRLADRSVVVKGLAEQTVESDFAVWTLPFRRGGNAFGEVQKSLAQDRDAVVAFLKARGFKDEEIEVRPLAVQDLFARDYGSGNQPLRFNGSGQVIVKSPRVAEVEAATLAVDPLIQAGVQLSSDGEGGVEYQLRGFNDVKAELLSAATGNARQQGEKFASEAGAGLGPLKSANQGVISISGDDGGDHDSGRSRMKRLRVVSTFVYELR